jgi:SAM-dependent methyltransferase
MIWLLLVASLVLICFSVVILFGAPYLPTLTPQVQAALELADLQPGDTLLELGCGDGKVLLAAARQGLNAVGYELNPFMAVIAWLRTRRYRRQVRVIWGNLWSQPWPEAEAIFVFLLESFMTKLDKKIMQYKHRPIKLVSFAFRIPGRQPASEKDGVYLYIYDKPKPSKRQKTVTGTSKPLTG